MKERNTSVEILRILSMMTIIGVHYWLSCGTREIIGPENSSYLLFQWMDILTSLGVNMFVIITSWFMVDCCSIKLRKAFDILWDVTLYGALMFTLSIIIGINTFSFPGLIKSLFPMLWGMRWFVRAYIILYLLIPFLNKCLLTIDRKTHLTLIVICAILFSIWPFMLPNPTIDDYGFGFINFVLIFIITSYIRRYIIDVKTIHLLMIFIGSSCSLWALMNATFLGTMNTMTLAHNSPIKLIACFSLFMLVERVHYYNKFINLLASGAFAVFLIHGEFNIMDWLFRDLFRGTEYQYGWIWFPHWLFTIVAVYIGAFVIDLVVKNTLGKLFKYIFDRIPILNFKISTVKD